MNIKKSKSEVVACTVNEKSEPVALSRRHLLKKSAYHVPALVALGGLIPVGAAVGASACVPDPFPCEPVGTAQHPKKQTPSDRKPFSG